MTAWRDLARRARLAGFGLTPFSKCSGVSEQVLARDAILAALTDAALSPADVDGLVTYDLDTNEPMSLAHAMGMGELRWWSTTTYGGAGACAAVQDAVLAVGAGLANVVVVYRAANMRSGHRYGQLSDAPVPKAWNQWASPFGVSTPAFRAGLWFQRYLHESKRTNADLAPVCVAARDFAATNPDAQFHGRPLTVEEHQSAPWVAEPVLRLPDCCLETDGGAAIIVASADVFPTTGGQPEIGFSAAARGMARSSSLLQNYYRDDIGTLPDLEVVAAQLWAQSGLRPADIDVAVIYDAFSPLVPLGLEALRLVERGAAFEFIEAGEIGRGGRLPVNPNGGQLGEAYLHGFNGIAEAVRQLRGTSVNQCGTPEHIVVTGGPAMPTSGMVLSRLQL